MNINNIYKVGALGCVIASFAMSSCSTITSAMPVENLPEPLKGKVVQMKKENEVVRKHYSQASSQMLEAKSLIYEGCGMEKEAQAASQHAKAIRQASSTDEADKLIVKGQKLQVEADRKMTKSKNLNIKSKSTFTKGYVKKEEAYKTLLRLGADAGTKAVKAGMLIKDASTMEKLALTAAFDPIMHIARDVPKYLETEKEFEEQCKEIGKKYSIPLPKTTYATPKSTGLGSF